MASLYRNYFSVVGIFLYESAYSEVKAQLFLNLIDFKEETLIMGRGCSY
jgi:hypothetical protein